MSNREEKQTKKEQRNEKEVLKQETSFQNSVAEYLSSLY